MLRGEFEDKNRVVFTVGPIKSDDDDAKLKLVGHFDESTEPEPVGAGTDET